MHASIYVAIGYETELYIATYENLNVRLVLLSLYMFICSCKKFEDHSSICFGYVNDDVYDHNQSNQINIML